MAEEKPSKLDLFNQALAEANEGQGLKIPAKLKNYFRFVLPVLILIIMVQSIIG